MDIIYYCIAFAGTVALVAIMIGFIGLLRKRDIYEDEQYVNRLGRKPDGKVTHYDYKADDDKVAGAKFRMNVEDVFSISGRGTVATGKTEIGPIQEGDEVVILRPDGMVIESRIEGIEQFRKKLNYAEAGSNVGLVLEGVKRNQLTKGSLIVKY